MGFAPLNPSYTLGLDPIPVGIADEGRIDHDTPT